MEDSRARGCRTAETALPAGFSAGGLLHGWHESIAFQFGRACSGCPLDLIEGPSVRGVALTGRGLSGIKVRIRDPQPDEHQRTVLVEGAEFGVLTLADNGRSLLGARSQRGFR